MRRDPRIVAAVVALLVAVGIAAFRITASGSNQPGRAGDQLLFRDDAAPEFAGLSRWFNAEPTTVRALRGKVVLIDFWTFSCVNCVRTFPEIRALHDTYKDAGLQVIGIHSPEFDFEKVPANVERAMRSHSVVWPVAMDNDHKTWEAFRNRFWPHVYLIDAKGRIRYDRVGEGGGEEIERAIRALLEEAGATVPPPSDVSVKGPSVGITPEIYLGWLRGEQQKFLGSESGFVRDEPHDYRVPVDMPAPGRGSAAFFLDGRWRATEEFVEVAAPGARIVLPFTARDVYVVAGPGSAAQGAVDVLLDGKPIDAARAGSEVHSGRVALDRKDLFQLVSLDDVETHELVLRAASPGAVFYAFTFG